MEEAIITLSAVALLIIVMAIVILMGKGDNLIAGYNTASEKTRKAYDVKRLRIVVGVMLIVVGLLLPVIGCFLVMGYVGVLATLAFLAAILAVVITAVILCNTWAKKKVEWDGKKVKKRVNAVLLPLIAALLMTGCSSYSMAPFASGSNWSRNGNTVSGGNPVMSINFGGDNIAPLSNLIDGDCDLHFIDSDVAFAQYGPVCRKFVTDVLKDVPLRFDTVQFILADKFVLLTPAVANGWLPDMVLQTDGVTYVAEANPVAGTVQSRDQLWRNVITDKRSKRVTVVDRFFKDGRQWAIVYVLQSQTQRLPFATAAHFDVADPRNVQAVGTWLESLMGVSHEAWLGSGAPRHNMRGD